MRFPFRNDSRPEGEAASRHAMVAEQLRARGIRDQRVLAAMSQVPRHAFVPPELRERAYWDGPLPIGGDQTISQPYIVGAMSEALGAPVGGRVLEIGTGSGYQAAVLAEMGLDVYTVEFLPRLAGEARARLEGLGYREIHYRIGDGRAGWPEQAPFDGILVTAAPADLPPAFAGQLAPGGRLVIPVGRWDQELRVYQRQADGDLSMQRLFDVRFVPLVGG